MFLTADAPVLFRSLLLGLLREARGWDLRVTSFGSGFPEMCVLTVFWRLPADITWRRVRVQSLAQRQPIPSQSEPKLNGPQRPRITRSVTVLAVLVARFLDWDDHACASVCACVMAVCDIAKSRSSEHRFRQGARLTLLVWWCESASRLMFGVVDLRAFWRHDSQTGV